jgi:DNA polymerase III delta prime subunit
MKWSHANIVIGSDQEAQEKLFNDALQDIQPRLRHEYGREEPLGISQIRDIKRKAYIAVPGAYQLFVLYQADTMTIEASHALLKIFEEPPKGSIFFLFAQSRSAIKDTIISRASIFYAQQKNTHTDEKRLGKKEFKDKRDAERFLDTEIQALRLVLEDTSKIESIKTITRKLNKCLAASQKLSISNTAPKYVVDSYEIFQ